MTDVQRIWLNLKLKETKRDTDMKSRVQNIAGRVRGRIGGRGRR